MMRYCSCDEGKKKKGKESDLIRWSLEKGLGSSWFHEQKNQSTGGFSM